MPKFLTKSLLIVLFAISLGSCSKDGSVNFFSVEDDKKLGLDVKNEIENNPTQYPILSENQYPQAYSYINHLRNQIVNSGKLFYAKDFAWEIKIIKNDTTLNAFCTPGGYIYVYTGLIKFLDSEDQLAGVLGHEIAHADHRHTTEQLTKAYGLEVLLSVVAGNNPGLMTQIASSLLTLSFSRANETESDKSSVNYLYPTEYDARGAARFFEKLINSGQGNQGPAFLSTHPNPDNRVENITKEWQTLGGKEGGTFTDRYAQFKQSLP